MAEFLELNFRKIDVIQGGDGSNGNIGYDIRVNGQVISHRWGDEIGVITNGDSIPLNFTMRVFGDVTIHWHAWDVDFFRDDDAGNSTRVFHRSDIGSIGQFVRSALIRNGVSLTLEYSVSRGTDGSVLWEQQTGRAKDIGVGADGSVWVIGTNPVGTTGFAGDFGIYKMNGSTWEPVDGGAARIAVGPNGKPWVVNKDGQIFQRVQDTWVKFPGLAKDIGVGADGSVWIIGTKPVNARPPYDFGIFRLNEDKWEAVDGGAVRISVGPNGMPWVVNSVGKIFRRDEGLWAEIPGRGTDIGIGKVSNFSNPQQSSVWLIGTDRVGNAGDFGVYGFVNGDWTKIDGGGIAITAGPDGLPWLVNSVGSIFRRLQ